MNYSFDDTVGASRKSFEGNAIYDVKFDGCEARDFTASQDASKTFHVLDIKFVADDGTKFTHTVFEPDQAKGDFNDQQGMYGPQPSRVKEMMLLFKHLIDAVNPDLGRAIDKKEKSLNTTSWDALRNLMVKATDPGKGTDTKIKLFKNNKGEASFPRYFAKYSSQDNRLYMSTNFIGKNIFLTSKELERISKEANAAPTPTEKIDEFSAPAAETKPDFYNLDI